MPSAGQHFERPRTDRDGGTDDAPEPARRRPFAAGSRLTEHVFDAGRCSPSRWSAPGWRPVMPQGSTALLEGAEPSLGPLTSTTEPSGRSRSCSTTTSSPDSRPKPRSIAPAWGCSPATSPGRSSMRASGRRRRPSDHLRRGAAAALLRPGRGRSAIWTRQGERYSGALEGSYEAGVHPRRARLLPRPRRHPAGPGPTR